MLSFIFTLHRARIKLMTPMLFALASMAQFIVGGITGVFNSSVALDYGLRGTYWVVGHFHYTLLGGAATGLIAGLYFWWPKISGKMYSEKLGKIHFMLHVIGFNLFAFSIHTLIDMPRRVYTYPVESGWLLNNQIATVGTFILGPSFLIMFLNFYRSLKKGEAAGDNPWSSWSLEWLTPSPPPPENFHGQPFIMSDGKINIAPVIKGASHANESHHTTVHHYSSAPLIASAGVFATLLVADVGLPITFVGIAILALSLVLWARESIKHKHGVVEHLVGERWPFHNVDKVRLGVWWMVFGEAVLFSGLILGYLWVRTMAPAWPAAGTVFNLEIGATNTFILLTSSFALVAALVSAKAGNFRMTRAGLFTTLVLGLLFLFNKYREWDELFTQGYTFGSGLPFTTFYITTGAHGVHVAAGLVALLYVIVKALRSGDRHEIHPTIESFGIYWHFVDIVWVFLFPLFYLY